MANKIINTQEEIDSKILKYFPDSRKGKALAAGKSFVALEGTEQKNFQSWLRKEYPDVRFTADFVGHAESLKNIAHIHRADNFTTPDLMIFEPSHGWHGIFMEFKTTAFKLYKRDGEVIKQAHIQDQMQTLLDLRKKGYYADFIAGEAHAQKVWNAYLGTGRIPANLHILRW